MIGYLLLFIVSILTCAGQLCQKQAAVLGEQRSAGAPLWPVLRWLAVAVVLLGVAMLLWLCVLQQLPLSVAYPMLSLNFVFITLSARWLYQERVDARHWLGIACIMLGILLMSIKL